MVPYGKKRWPKKEGRLGQGPGGTEDLGGLPQASLTVFKGSYRAMAHIKSRSEAGLG
jgi:hypothetical protein